MNTEEIQQKLDNINKKLDEQTSDIRMEISDLIDEINKSENEEPEKESIWTPDVGEEYLYISAHGIILKNENQFTDFDKMRFEIGNCFKTKEQAEKHLEHLKVETQLRDIAERLNKGREIDWGTNCRGKYFLHLELGRVCSNYDFCIKRQGVIYCLDENFKDAAIQEIGEERLKEYLKEC